MMNDDELEEELKKRVVEQEKNRFLFCLGLFLCIIVMGVALQLSGDGGYNVTEVVRYKEIAHDYRFVDEIHYYVYTDSESFELPLKYFNKLSENDTVVLQKSNNTGRVLLFVDGQNFSNC